MFQENEGGLEVGAIQNSIEKWLKLRGGKTTLRGGGVAKCPPSNPLKNPACDDKTYLILIATKPLFLCMCIKRYSTTCSSPEKAIWTLVNLVKATTTCKILY